MKGLNGNIDITSENRNSFAEACIEIAQYLKQNQEKLHTPNSIALKTKVNRQTVEKAIKFMEIIQAGFFDAYEIDVEEMNNNRKVVGISNRRKFSEYPIELQKQEIKRNYPKKSEEEIDALFKKSLVH